MGKEAKGPKDVKDMEAVEKVLRALHDERNGSRLTLKEVEKVVRDLELVPGNNPKAITALARAALNEARNRIQVVLDGVRESLGISSPLPPRMAKILANGYSLVLATPHHLPGHVEIKAVWDEVLLSTPSPIEIWPSAALVGSKGGDIAFDVGIPYTVFARRGRVSFYSPDRENMKRAHTIVKAFRPLFRAMALEDLEEAFDALTTLRDGQVRMEGAYVLARRGDQWALRRGSIFGTPLLDRAFLLGGEELVFSYPKGLEIAFITDPIGHKVQIKAIKVRWGEEMASYYPSQWRSPAPEVEVIDEELPGALIRVGLKGWLGNSLRPKQSPRMEALLRELSETPLEASKSEEFLRRVHMQALAEY